MHYHDFDLWIESSAAGLKLRSSCAEHGEYRDEGQFDLAAFRRAEHDIVESDAASETIVDVGKQLYSFAFASAQRHIEWHFAQCWGASGRGDNGVRVRLRVEDANVASIPWEFLYSEQMQSFLGVSIRTPVIRYLELPRPIGMLEAPLPVRMLVVIPRVADLKTDVERKELVETLAPLSEVVALTILEGAVTRQDIADALISQQFHVIHFIGHGDFDGEKAVLALNKPDGTMDLVDHETLSQMVRNHATLKLVVLNSCRGGQLSETKPLVGMAASLVKDGVPAVIAMQYEVQDREAITFARTFYRALFTGADRGRIEMALSHGRNALAVEYPDTLALGIPVLFTHAREGVLFELGGDQQLPDRPLSRGALRRDQAVLATHKRNIELLTEAGAEEPAPPVDIEAEKKAYDKIARRIRLRHASAITAVSLAVLIFLVSMLAGFQRLPPQLRVESYAVWLTDMFDSHELDPSIVIVGADERSERELGPLNAAGRFAWRSRHAQLIDRLSNAGVKTIAFLLVFDEPSPADDSLAASISRARARGTQVLIGVDSFVAGKPVLASSIASVAQWGPACLGENTVHSLKMMPLMIAGSSPAKPARLKSLALQTVLAHKRAAVDESMGLTSGLRVSGQKSLLRPSEVLIARSDEAGCRSIAAGDTVAEEYVEYSKLSALRDPKHRRSYGDVLGGSNVANLENTIAVVGRDVPGSMHFDVARGAASVESRASIEVFADAVNSLLSGKLIRPLGEAGQFVFILIMAVAGAVIGLLADKALPRIGLIAAALVAYALVAMWFYSSQHLLLNTVFHVIALITAFFAVVLLRRKWFT
jgi:CHASE2 domain-containing sensor protein